MMVVRVLPLPIIGVSISYSQPRVNVSSHGRLLPTGERAIRIHCGRPEFPISLPPSPSSLYIRINLLFCPLLNHWSFLLPQGVISPRMPCSLMATGCGSTMQWWISCLKKLSWLRNPTSSSINGYINDDEAMNKLILSLGLENLLQYLCL